MLNWIRAGVLPFPPFFGGGHQRQMAIFDEAGDDVGFVDLIEMRQNNLTVSGWVVADRVQMVLGGQTVSTVPDQLREDVAREKGLDPRAGFTLVMHAPPRLRAQSDPPGLVFTPRPGAFDIPSLSFSPD